MLTVDSPNSFSTFMVNNPFWLIHPLNTSSPESTSFGMDSPVKAEVSIKELPSTTIPSKGIFSPGFITIVSPIFTSSGFTFSNFPFLSIFA